MNREFFELALDKLNFPDDGKGELIALFDKVKDGGFESRIEYQ